MEVVLLSPSQIGKLKLRVQGSLAQIMKLRGGGLTPECLLLTFRQHYLPERLMLIDIPAFHLTLDTGWWNVIPQVICEFLSHVGTVLDVIDVFSQKAKFLAAWIFQPVRLGFVVATNSKSQWLKISKVYFSLILHDNCRSAGFSAHHGLSRTPADKAATTANIEGLQGEGKREMWRMGSL